MAATTLAGFHNRVARIDLTTGAITYEPVDDELARKYLGGRGLGVKYVFDHGIHDPLSPDNMLAIMTGPLTGSEVKMSGRLSAVTRSPLTGTIADSHMGGWTAAYMKWSGFDALLITGKADHPVYLLCKDGEVSIEDASDLWGKTTHETHKALMEKHPGKYVDVMAVGPAAEHGVRFGNWVNKDDRACGRNGTGTVGASKNLKAIVFVGDKKNQPKPADREAFKEADKKALSAIMAEANITAPRKGGLSVYGTNVLMNITGSIGALPAWNGKKASFISDDGEELYERISGERVREEILVGDPTCHACPVACKIEVEVPEGKFKVHMESVEYESIWSLGAMCGNASKEAAAFMIDQANRFGMDTIELGVTLSMYMEACEKGLAVNGEVLNWGDADAMIAMIENIAYAKTEAGKLLAFGAAGAAEKLGHPELAMSVKGQAIPAYDPRGLKGMGIAYATSNRGACHLRAYTPAAELGVMPFGSLKVDPLEWKGKGELVKVFQDIHAISDSFDICKFSAFAEGVDEYLEQYNTFTGANLTADGLLKAGERIYNLERYYNNLVGFREGSDYLPERFLKEPSTAPGSEGHVCELDLMLEEYYKARGWENAVVPESKLKELDIL
ncbi:MAG TPA: aldehyde ferredoxin oxidoreductase [Anaerolineae bacterium]|nr:aldehyde ferredoxin oxidoreductase family protein [Caldilineae bacterium]HID35689.1 aldehyde ferredoxin oxidoreductase [Anaerolineae bacterium]HIQ12566.1 aldehyde ferredoxin oxidoreductase [Caldilineales bacterium]